jgi:acetoin utilization protein AcuB
MGTSAAVYRSMLMPPIARYMTSEVYVVSPRERLSPALHLMGTRNIHHLPVIERDELVGVVSDRDLHIGHGSHDLTVRDLMTDDVACVPPETPMNEVLDLMERRRCSSVVVMGKKGIAGIFTVNDALRALGDLLRRTVEGQP